MKNKNSEIVYSTDPEFKVEDTPAERAGGRSEKLIVSLDRKQRAGKSVTLVQGFTGWSDDKMESLARKLKSQCATGGTVKDRTIEIQGDQRKKIDGILQKMGFKTRITNDEFGGVQ